MKDSAKNSSKVLSKEKMLAKLKNKEHYQFALYQANQDKIAAWVLVEILSFGEFLQFFKFYFKKFRKKSCKLEIKSLMGLLYAVKNIRDACAHSTTILHDFRVCRIKRTNKELENYIKERSIRGLSFKYAKVYDLMAVIYIHEKYVLGEESRRMRKNELIEWAEQARKTLHYLNYGNDLNKIILMLENAIDKYQIKA